MAQPALIPQPREDAPLKALELRNFRAFEKQRVELAPITILVGPNNAGKSSVISALRLLSQTIQSVDTSAPLVLGDFGTYKDIVFGNKSARTIGFRIEFTDLSRLSDANRSYAFEVNFGYRAQRREVILQNFAGFDQGAEPIVRTTYSRVRGRQLLQHIRGVPAEVELGTPIRFYHFLPRILFSWTMRLSDRLAQRMKASQAEIGQSVGDPSGLTKMVRSLDRALSRVSQVIGSLQYLGPFREQPSRVYPFSGERPSLLNASGHGATDILMADYFRRGSRKRELTKAVQGWLDKAHIASDLQMSAVSDRHYDVKMKHPITGEIENLADVGFGTSQILPVIVAGYNLAPQSIFLVEQPEIHLHPRAQSELGDFFGDLYVRGVQSIIETHSEHLILRIQRLVASGLIPPKDVAVNYIDATMEGKKISRLDLDENGIFTTSWPHGFFEERLEEALELARAPLQRKEKIG